MPLAYVGELQRTRSPSLKREVGEPLARLRASLTRYGEPGGDQLERGLIPTPTLPFLRGGSAPCLRQPLRPDGELRNRDTSPDPPATERWRRANRGCRRRCGP